MDFRKKAVKNAEKAEKSLLFSLQKFCWGVYYVPVAPAGGGDGADIKDLRIAGGQEKIEIFSKHRLQKQKTLIYYIPVAPDKGGAD